MVHDSSEGSQQTAAAVPLESFLGTDLSASRCVGMRGFVGRYVAGGAVVTAGTNCSRKATNSNAEIRRVAGVFDENEYLIKASSTTYRGRPSTKRGQQPNIAAQTVTPRTTLTMAAGGFRWLPSGEMISSSSSEMLVQSPRLNTASTASTMTVRMPRKMSDGRRDLSSSGIAGRPRNGSGSTPQCRGRFVACHNRCYSLPLYAEVIHEGVEGHHRQGWRTDHNEHADAAWHPSRGQGSQRTRAVTGACQLLRLRVPPCRTRRWPMPRRNRPAART